MFLPEDYNPILSGEALRDVCQRLVPSNISNQPITRKEKQQEMSNGEPTKHILLPVWISAYRYNNKVYHFMINARTGEVQGERPYSVIKILLTILGAVAIAMGVWISIN